MLKTGLAVLVAIIVADAAVAQTVGGRVLDDLTGDGVAEATVTLLDDRMRVVGRVVTGAAGAFEVTGRTGGSHVLRVERIGYAGHQSPPLELVPGESLEVEFRLAVDGILLAPITVVARHGRERGRDQFARYRELGRGFFLDPKEIVELEPTVATEAFRTVPSLVLERAPGEGGQDILVPYRGWGCLVVFMDHATRPIMQVVRYSAMRGGLDLTLASNIDEQWSARPANEVGIRLPFQTREASLDRFRETGQTAVVENPWFEGHMNEWLRPDRIRAVEVYLDPADLPRELRDGIYATQLNPIEAVGTCSVARVWTTNGW